VKSKRVFSVFKKGFVFGLDAQIGIRLRIATALTMIHLHPYQAIYDRSHMLIKHALGPKCSAFDKIAAMIVIVTALREPPSQETEVDEAAQGDFGGEHGAKAIDVTKLPRVRCSLIDEMKLDYLMPIFC